MKIELRPLHPSFGAEVVGVDLARNLDEETIVTIQDAWTRCLTPHSMSTAISSATTFAAI